MPIAPPRPCLQPGCGAVVRNGSRCPQHQRSLPHRSRHQQGYDNDWARLAKRTIQATPWCASCFATTDLVADHIVPLRKGGLSIPDNIQVLCRSCNSRKASQ